MIHTSGFVFSAENPTPMPRLDSPGVETDGGDARRSVGATPLSASEIESAVGQLLREAITFDEAELSLDRARATRFYKGDPFGDEEDGRSQVVLTELRDAVQQVLPSLANVFLHNADHIVEFEPRGPNDIEGARQRTDYVKYVIMQDNPGFAIHYAAWKDALVRRRGIIKWWWEDKPLRQSEEVHGLTREQIAMLEQDGVRVRIKYTERASDNTESVCAEITQSIPDGRARIEAIPSEEFLHSRNARSLRQAPLIAHRREMTASELRQLGVPQDEIDHYGSTSHALLTTPDAIARAVHNVAQPDAEPRPEARKIPYVEAYTYLDEDGDGIAEHRKICLLGTGFHLIRGEDGELWDEAYPERPFAYFVPDPEPHTMVGLSWADFTMDIQDVKSHVMRGILDSLSQSIHPRTTVVENAANIADVMNTEIGAVIRMDAPGMVQEFAHSFVGGQAFPVLTYMDDVKQSRTGTTKYSQGLEPDALQSSTRVAVEAAIQAAVERRVMLCRVFAETGEKDLMTGIANLLRTHQPRGRMVKLRGKWIEMDPRVWDADPTCRVNVGMGTGLVEQRTQVLTNMIQEQKEWLKTVGMSNPAVSLPQYLNAVHRVLELNGVTDPTEFFQSLPMNWKAPDPPPPPPSPEQVLQQVEQMKAQKDMQIEDAKLRFKQQEMALKAELETLKLAVQRQDMMVRALASGRQLDLREAEVESQRILDGMQHALDEAQMVAQAKATQAPGLGTPSGE